MQDIRRKGKEYIRIVERLNYQMWNCDLLAKEPDGTLKVIARHYVLTNREVREYDKVEKI